MSVAPSQAMLRLVDFLGDLGPRWGLPAEACRVHGYLYLRARSTTTTDVCAALSLDVAAVDAALTWLHDYRLVERGTAATWRTSSDPWDLMMRALDERRRRELRPALDTLKECRRVATIEHPRDPIMYAQIVKLLELAEDLDAIDVQTRHLSSKTMRRMVGIGGRAARFVNRTFTKRDA